MPVRAKHFCNHPGCNQLVDGRYCEEHARLHEQMQTDDDKQYDKRRGTSSGRGYSTQWQKVRIAHLRSHPLCAECEREGMTVPAVLVHHVTPLRENGAAYDANNLVSLCSYHHERIHGKDRFKRKV